MKIKLMLIAVLVGLGLTFVNVRSAEATNNFDFPKCPQGTHGVWPLCFPNSTPTPTPSVTPSVTLTPTVTPSETPSLTPTETLTPTPEPSETPVPCGQQVEIVSKEWDEEEPSVTPCPSETPTPTPVETGIGGSIELTPAGAPTCDGVPFVKLPGNVNVLRNGAMATVRWNPTQGGQAEIYYQNMHTQSDSHALRDIENDGVESIFLLGNKDWRFGVQQKDGCAFSGVVWVDDGSAPRLYSLPAYDIITGQFLK
jgi:hypothetical protein